MELSAAQERASRWIDTPVIITAGAGAGKTFTITKKFEYLIKNGYNPEQILCITFTNKAANELKERLVGITNRPLYHFTWTRTIHSACLQMLKPYFGRLDYRPPVTVCATGEQRQILRNVLKDFRINAKEFLLPVMKIISDAKDNTNPKKYISENIEKFRKTNLRDITDNLVGVFDSYMYSLKNNNSIDFDDILWYTHNLLSTHADFREYYKNLFQYILVDEYQDVNFIQNEIVKLLTNENNLTVVGDDFQAIYGWRGSNPKFFVKFEDQFPSAKLFKLEQNYRSTDEIVEISNHLISKNKHQIPKVCFSTIPSVSKPSIVKFEDDNEESDMIANACKKYKELENIPLNEIAILYRAKFISRSIEQALVSYSLPYTVIGSVAFFERREIKDIMSYILYSINPNNETAFERCMNTPKRGLGKKTLEIIKKADGKDLMYKTAYCLKHNKIGGKAHGIADQVLSFVFKLKNKRPHDAIQDVIEFTNYLSYMKSFSTDEDDYEDRNENIRELLGLASKSTNVEEFIEECSLINPEDNTEEEKIKLMTVHAAKGLEFKVVFVIGMEDGLFPHHKALKQDRDNKSNLNLEEERRLFYVAITRPEQLLNITYCNKRTCSFASVPSRFLKEISKYCNIEDLTK